MSDSLRDQLLGLGFKPPAASGKKPEHSRQGQGKPDRRQSAVGDAAKKQTSAKPNAKPPVRPKSAAEIDLAKAYAIRSQREKDERIETERLKQEAARRRREARAKLVEWAKDKALNDPQAEIARHFNYGGKIKRIYVNDAQLKALNAGELGVVQIDGRYLLLTATAIAEAEAIYAPAVALKIDPNAPAEQDPYADPQYQVPDDLVW